MNKLIGGMCFWGVTSIAMAVGSIQSASAAVGVAVECPLTGPGVAICAPVALTLHEVVKCANGDDCFGDSGEVLKILSTVPHVLEGNIKGAERENGAIEKLIRSTTGISSIDIKTHGLAGGENSELRKGGRVIADVFGW